MFTVIAYDVADDHRRTRICAFLADYGTRVNYSVFECELDRDEFAQVVARLAELIDDRKDRIVLYRLCESCRVKRSVIGQVSEGKVEKGIVVI